jgi:hypothetical protein
VVGGERDERDADRGDRHLARHDLRNPGEGRPRYGRLSGRGGPSVRRGDVLSGSASGHRPELGRRAEGGTVATESELSSERHPIERLAGAVRAVELDGPAASSAR